MNGKDKKKAQVVIDLNLLNSIFHFIDAGMFENITVGQLKGMIQKLPNEMRVVMDSTYVLPNGVMEKSDYAFVQNYKKAIIRTELLEDTAIAKFRKSVLAESCFDRITDKVMQKLETNLKDSLAKQINGVTTVAGLTSVPNIRSVVEANLSAKDLFQECRCIGELPMNTSVRYKRAIDQMDGAVDEENCNSFTIEAVAVYKENNTNFVNALFYNQKLLNIMSSHQFRTALCNAAFEDGLVKVPTASTHLIALSAYFGLFHTPDTFAFKFREKMTVRQFVIMLGRAGSSIEPIDSILSRIQYQELGIGLDDIITRYHAVKLVLQYYDEDTRFMVEKAIKCNSGENTTGSMIFPDIPKESKYDTVEVAALCKSGYVLGDSNGCARLDQELTMNEAAVLLCQLILAIKDTIDSSTEYVSAPHGSAS